MLLTKTVQQEIQEIEGLICDRCKRKVTDELELQEAYSIQFTGGFSSVFGDMNAVSCDLCQDCLMALIGGFCVYNGENQRDAE